LGMPAPLVTLGACHVVLALVAVIAVVVLGRRVRRNGVVRAVTWDCGYAAPAPRMQYTAGSFAGIITGWFAWILRPERHARLPEGPFPGGASYAERTPETVLERVVRPVASLVMAVAETARRLQHGRLQAYIFYVVLGLLGLALLMLAGGGS
jgi:hydrogenase-4 component B